MRVAALATILFGVSGVDGSASTVLVRAGENLQAAINAAQAGDVILLEAGATFTGNFVLPVKAGAEFITIRTDDPSGSLPPDGQRVSPAVAHALAKIRSGNTMAALRTAPGAHHWRLVLLEFPANREGYGDILQIGDGSSAQNHPSKIPYEIDLDRLYIHGDPQMGQKRGIALNGGTVNIRNSYVSDIRGVGMDTQAIGGWNGTGPYLIENNYLEAAGENLMLGGADPYISGLVPSNVIVRNNHFSRPMSWRDPVVAAPSDVVGSSQPGGSLAGGTYTYRIVARKRVGSGVVARSSASAEVLVPVTGGSAVALSWTPVAGADDYDVYVRTPHGVTQYWTTSASAFLDTGAAGRSGSAPTSAGHSWTVKNLLELKNARNVVIDQNVFENHWAGAQAGYAIVFTPRNQDGGCAWCVVEDVTFSNNLVRNAAGGINILGSDDLRPSLQTNRIRIRNNVFHLRRSLGGSAWFMLLGNAPRDITVDHNTVDADGTTLLYVYSRSSSVQPIYGFRFTNNAARHGDYGINGSEASFGKAIIQLYFVDGVVAGNWLQGAVGSRYPNNYVDGSSFESAFRDAPNGDYSVALGGPVAYRAMEGGHIGANPTPAGMVNAILGGRPRPGSPRGMRVVLVR
jgi:hypothetical protein